MESKGQDGNRYGQVLRTLWWVAIPVLLAAVLRGLYYAQVHNHPLFRVPTMDAWHYDSWARTIAGGDLLAPAGEPYYQPPLYPFFLSVIYALFGGSLPMARLVQFTMGAASCGLVCLIARRYFGPRLACLAGIICAVNASLIYYEGELLPPSLSIFLSLAAIWVLVTYQDRPSTWRAPVAGALLGLSGVARPDALAFVPVAALWVYMVQKTRKTRWPAIALLIAAAALPPAAVTFRNYAVSGQTAIISYNGGLNFFIGNNTNSTWYQQARPHKREWAALVYLPVNAGITEQSEQSSFYYREALAEYRRSPMLLPKLMAKKALLFWNGKEIRRNHDDYFYRSVSPVYASLTWKKGGFGFPFGVLGPLALLGLGLLLPRKRDLFLLYGYVGVQFLVVVAYFVTSRYRAPAIPVLSIFAAVALSEIARVIRARDLRSTFAYAAYLVPLVAISLMNSPLTNENQRIVDAETFQYVGYAENELGHEASALNYLHKCISLDPDCPFAHQMLGDIYLKRGRLRDATAEYKTALKILPTVDEARKGLELVRERESGLPSR
jgi:4-amino-4-deoxy-L-arabinose transferase-like glycosyltransferase